MLKKRFLLSKTVVAIIFVVSIIVFVNCEKRNESVFFKKAPTKEYVFDIGYNTARINEGVFNKGGKYFFYFFHHIYTNYISIFDENAQKVDSVDIREFNQPNNEVLGVKFLNSDTILLRNRKGTQFFIDRTGRLLHILDIKRDLYKKIEKGYNIYKYMYNISKDTAVFITNYDDKDNPYKPNNNYCRYLRYFAKKSFNSKRLLFVKNIFKDSVVTKHTLSKFEYNYQDTNSYSDINPYLYIKYPNIFLFTIFSNEVFIYSIEKDSIIDSFKINSKYSNHLYTEPFKMKGDCIKKIKKISYTGMNGSLLDMYYSPYTNYYYFSIRIPENESDNGYRYSVIKLDTSFKKIGESELTKEYPVFFKEKGVFFQDINSSSRIKKEIKYKYYEFKK